VRTLARYNCKYVSCTLDSPRAWSNSILPVGERYYAVTSDEADCGRYSNDVASVSRCNDASISLLASAVAQEGVEWEAGVVSCLGTNSSKCESKDGAHSRVAAASFGLGSWEEGAICLTTSCTPSIRSVGWSGPKVCPFRKVDFA
jgi:hypothetical protein